VGFFDAVDESRMLDYAFVFLGVYEGIRYDSALAMLWRNINSRPGFRGLGSYRGAFARCGGRLVDWLAFWFLETYIIQNLP
jgi:hypothetical protein